MNDIQMLSYVIPMAFTQNTPQNAALRTYLCYTFIIFIISNKPNIKVKFHLVSSAAIV